MTLDWLFPLTRQTFDAPCTIEIGHTAESLFAHVEIEGDFEMHPGDRVLVQDAPTETPFGHRIKVKRHVTITPRGPSGAPLDAALRPVRNQRALRRQLHE